VATHLRYRNPFSKIDLRARASTNVTTYATHRDISHLPGQAYYGNARREKVSGAEIFGRVSKPSDWVVETFERAGSFQELEHSGQGTLDREAS